MSSPATSTTTPATSTTNPTPTSPPVPSALGSAPDPGGTSALDAPAFSPVFSPVFSMTGFARVAGRVTDALAFTLTLKTVNHRFLDLHMRMPAGTEAVEMRLRRLLKDKVARGHLEVTLALERSGGDHAEFNREVLATYIAAFHSAAALHNLDQQPDLNLLFRLPGVLSGDTAARSDGMDLLEDAVMAQVDAAVAALNTMRAEEGDALARELIAGLERLRLLVAEVARLREDVQQAYCDRLTQRIATLAGGAVDRDRVLQEAAVLAERSDVEEEVSRLRTHIQHFRSLLAAGGSIGKKLDFLLQEMNREANTLLSKTGGVPGGGQKITELGLGIRSEIEKAREQVQNLE